MALHSGVVEQKRDGLPPPTPRRVKMIFSVMANPSRIDILRILNARGMMTYSEIKALAGFRSKKESGKFAYHLRKLSRQSLVSLNKMDKRYSLTNLGKLVLSLAKQIEERSIVESNKLYVRSSIGSIDEFQAHRITQSLSREGGLPPDLAEKITEAVESRIYAIQPTYVTGSLIRDMANSILLEQGHEEYRAKLARFGMPAHDVQELLSNVDRVDRGAEGVMSIAGRSVLAERLLSNVLPKDVADQHYSGDVHIDGPGAWSLLPDTLFLSLRELVSDGLSLGGKFLGTSRVQAPKTLPETLTAVSMSIAMASREVAREVVLDGLQQMLARHAKDPLLEEGLAHALASSTLAPMHAQGAPRASLRVALGSEARAVSSIIAAYTRYARITPLPSICLVVDRSRGRLSDYAGALAEAVSLGGRVMLAAGASSSAGLSHRAAAGSPPSINLQSVSLNLPRLAIESNRDETYFRARLALLMPPALLAMSQRKKEISDLTRRGLNPMLARSTQYMQRGTVSLVVNLTGLHEAVAGFLGYGEGEAGRAVMRRVVETAVDTASKKSKELGEDVRVCITETAGSSRFADLDGQKYKKGEVDAAAASGSYSDCVEFDAAAEYAKGSGEVAWCNDLAAGLTGGLMVRLDMGERRAPADIRSAIERFAPMLPSFMPSVRVPICGACGYKDAAISDKCPRCRSPYII